MGWMAWTLPGALFFISIAVALMLMTALEIYRPTTIRRGFLRMETTRGDRFFMSLLGSAFIHIAWLATSDMSLFFASAISVVYTAVLMRWG